MSIKTSISTLALATALSLTLAACGGDKPTSDKTTETMVGASDATAPQNALPEIQFERYQLDNGLDVILHIDKSDPIVAINLAAHVGSAREVTGRTGFAHLFEHLLFLDSENLGYGGLDEMNTRIGGEGTNGFTTNDMTQYFQAVPSDALEKVVWAEADKLGYFIKTVTQPVIDKEKQVVKNEKRQRVDNQPYGHNWYVIGKALYPADHPYNWQVIGSLADLDAASLQDVKDFYSRWYVPNNVTLTLTGDFDVAEAKTLIEKYFGEIPRGEAVAPLTPRPGVLMETKNLMHLDSFAKVPQLTMVWPTVEQYNPDAYALDVLSTYLTDGKRAPLNEVLIDETKVTSSVSAFQNSSELAGEYYLIVRANADQDLDAVQTALMEGLARFEANGISEKDLQRIKTQAEVDFYGQIESVLGKAIQLAQYNIFKDDPALYKKELQAIRDLTPSDLMRVYNTYIKDKPYIATSFVPKDQPDLALEGAVKADVVEEKVVQGAEDEVDFDPSTRVIADPTPSSFDRTIEPALGGEITFNAPKVWRDSLSNGIALYGIENSETPLVYFSLKIDAGDNRGSVDKPAVATLTAALLEKGTANLTTAELEDQIKSLGSSISVSSGTHGTYVTGSTLSRNFDATLALAKQMVLEPRWDADELATLIREAESAIDQSAANPSAIARREMQAILYPETNILSVTGYGPKDKLDAITMEDLKAFYAETYSPANAQMRVAGDIKPATVKSAMASWVTDWTTPAPDTVSNPMPKTPETSKVYFYDVPDSKQSVLRLARPAMAATDSDYVRANAVNYMLGNIYTSKLNTELRVNKGYTYGIGSSFSSDQDRGLFIVGSSVRTNVTLESVQAIHDILEKYGEEFTADDLNTLKDALIKGQALTSETLSSKLDMLGKISSWNWPDDYLEQHAEEVRAMTLPEFKALAAKYLRPDAMYYVIVGDAATQAERMDALGYGEPVMLKPSK